MQSYCVALSGVTFLIAYLIMLMVSGLPLFFLELALGQYAGKGPLKVFGRMAPAMKVGQLLLPTIANLVTNCCLYQGLGYGMLFITFLVAIYYNLIIAWTIYYTFAGFTSGENIDGCITNKTGDCH